MNCEVLSHAAASIVANLMNRPSLLLSFAARVCNLYKGRTRANLHPSDLRRDLLSVI
jgi:hypothetical protein